MEQLIIEASSIECSESRREISGKIVPMGTGEIGHTNMGGVVFEAGSIEIDDPTTIKLLSQHDMKKPIGRMVTATVRPDGIYATFKLSRSSGGDDALIMAQEGLVSGLSVGAEVIASKPSRDGYLVVSAAKLKEVSLVTEPAFKSAQVLEIAAEAMEAATSTSTKEKTTTINTIIVETETETETEIESEPIVEDTTKAEAPAVEAAAVEAARPTVAASLQVRERIAPITSEQYLSAHIKAAAFNDEDARRTILAADDSTATNTGLTLPSHLTNFITTTFSGRPAWDAVTRAGAVPQLSFTVPKMGTAPTVATTAEGAAPSETGMTSSYDTVTAVKKSGIQRISFELLDFSNPAFETILMSELRKAYEADSDNYLLAAFAASGTAATATAATAAGLQSFISVEAAAAYKGTGGDRANKLVASVDQWAAITGYADTTGRPLYAAQGQTFNAAGNVVPTNVMGNVLGTDLIVDHNISTVGIVDNSAFLVAPGAVWAWESPVANLRVNVLTSGEVEICLYAYNAVHIGKPAGVRKYNLV